MKPASKVIALEEAFLHPKVWAHFPESLRQRYEAVKPRLTDVGPERIRRMAAAGIDIQVLSLVQPGIQIFSDADAELAAEVSREVNDWLGEVVRTYPTRFAGFAALPTQSPAAAADELARAVTDLGLKGALINGHTNGRYLDDPSFGVLLARAEALNVPLYLHPTDPPQDIRDRYYAPYADILVPTWGWPVETGTHLLRMVCGGVFDRHPTLKIIVGHLGELIPYCYTRLTMGVTMAEWLLSAKEKGSQRTGMTKNVGYYLRKNVFVTSSGVFDQPVFDCARAMLGLDNLMFSVDDPFQDNFAAMEFLNGTNLTQPEREQFAHGTAERLLGLDPTPRSTTAGRPTVGDSLHAFTARAKSVVGRALISALVK